MNTATARRPSINIQDSFLFGNLKESCEVAVALTTGKAFNGTVRRYALRDHLRRKVQRTRDARLQAQHRLDRFAHEGTR